MSPSKWRLVRVGLQVLLTPALLVLGLILYIFIFHAPGQMTNPWEERAESWSETTPLASREGGDAVSNENATNTTNQEANQYDVVANNGIVCEDDPSLRHGEKSCEWVGKNLSRCWNYVEEELVLSWCPKACQMCHIYQSSENEHPFQTNEGPLVVAKVARKDYVGIEAASKKIVYVDFPKNRLKRARLAGFTGGDSCGCPIEAVDAKDLPNLDWETVGTLITPTQVMKNHHIHNGSMNYFYDSVPPEVLTVLSWREGAASADPTVATKFDVIMGPHVDDEIMNPCFLPADFHHSQILPIVHKPFSERNHFAVHVTSHCNVTYRTRFISELQKHVDVEVHGKCAKRNYSLPVPESRSRAQVKKFLSNFKFFIASENVFTNGYISEKIFNSLGSGAIPVYLGASTANQLPLLDGRTKWFIDARDFPNEEAVAKYMLDIASNETKFREYLQWQDYAKAGGTFMPNAIDRQKECFHSKLEVLHTKQPGMNSRHNTVCKLCQPEYREAVKKRKRITPVRVGYPFPVKDLRKQQVGTRKRKTVHAGTKKTAPAALPVASSSISTRTFQEEISPPVMSTSALISEGFAPEEIMPPRPDWLSDYIDYHRNSLESDGNDGYRLKEGVPFLVYECSGETKCGGIGDRIRSMVILLYLAMCSGRVLIINSPYPSPLQNFLEPALIHWDAALPQMVDGEELELPTLDIMIRSNNDLLVDEAIVGYRLGRCNGRPARHTLRSIFANQCMGDYFSKQRDEPFPYPGAIPQERLLRWSFYSLFKFSDAVLLRAEELKKSAGLAGVPYTGIHLRTGDQSMGGKERYAPRFQHIAQKQTLHGKCYKKMKQAHPGVQFGYVASDSDDAKQFLNAIDKSILYSNEIEIFHVEQTLRMKAVASVNDEELSYRGSLDVWAELVVLADSKCVIMSWSTLSFAAHYLGGEHRCGIYVEDCMEEDLAIPHEYTYEGRLRIQASE